MRWFIRINVNVSALSIAAQYVLIHSVHPPPSRNLATLSGEALIDELRRQAVNRLDPKRRAAMGQFMTPSAIARFMASLFRNWSNENVLLDPGAGVGSLTDAFVERFTKDAPNDARLVTFAYEVEPLLLPYLQAHLASLQSKRIETNVIDRDFLREASFASFFGSARFSHVMLNPPYKKIGAASEYRLLLRDAGIEAVNLYAAFLGLAISLTKPRGEIVAIVPRSFCNGRYYKPFRKWLLRETAITHIHVFESRTKPFDEDDVLQENVIIRLERGVAQGKVAVSASHDQSYSDYLERSISFDEVVKPDDEESYIRIPTIDVGDFRSLFVCKLSDLGLEVATGPVVDFRLRQSWQQEPTDASAPLLYAHHFRNGEMI